MKTQQKIDFKTKTYYSFDENTGEYIPIGVGEFHEVKQNVDEKFSKVFNSFWSAMKQIDDNITKYLCYIVENLSNKNIMAGKNDSEIAEKLKISRQTIGRIKKALRGADIIKYSANIVFVNPDMIYRGYASRRQEVRSEYIAFTSIGDQSNYSQKPNFKNSYEVKRAKLALYY